MTRKEEIKLLATIELTNTNPFNKHLIKLAIIASTLAMTAIAAFSVGSDHGIERHHEEMLMSLGMPHPPPRDIHN